MPKIFVSYRRVDSAERSHRISDWLALKYGHQNIFIDVDTLAVGIKPGVAFADFIQEWMNGTDVVLVIIGDKWVDEIERRYNPNSSEMDFVYFEVVQALKQQVLVVPVLLDRSITIDSTRLPEAIKPITQLNYTYVRLSDFHNDMASIASRIDEDFPKRFSRKTILLMTVITFFFMFAIILGLTLSNSTNQIISTEDMQGEINGETQQPILSGTEYEQTVQVQVLQIQTEVAEQETATAFLWTDTPTLIATETPDTLATAYVRLTKEAIVKTSDTP